MIMMMMTAMIMMALIMTAMIMMALKMTAMIMMALMMMMMTTCEGLVGCFLAHINISGLLTDCRRADWQFHLY